MSGRELLALGTASQVPTKRRNHNGYFLRWDAEGFLFDPGEGTQRQMAHGELASSSIHRIFITHFHGDHCLGLAGIIQRLSLDRVAHPVTIHYPASGQEYFDRLRSASIFHLAVELQPHPIDDTRRGLIEIARTDSYTVFAHQLEHGVPTLGYRIEEHAGRTFIPAQLEAAGVRGPLIGKLSREGSVQIGDKTVTIEEVSAPRRGTTFAFVMDTRVCEGAHVLAQGADLLLMESTYTKEDQALATEHFHCSAADAAQTAAKARVQKLALTHFSQRYLHTDQHLADARAIFPNTIALHDLDRTELPRHKGGTEK